MLVVLRLDVYESFNGGAHCMAFFVVYLHAHCINAATFCLQKCIVFIRGSLEESFCLVQ